MTAITTQLADIVVDTINNGGPYAVEFFAERYTVAHRGREEIEDMQVSVVALARSSTVYSRGIQLERIYPVQIVIDYAVDPGTRTERIDCYHEVIEQIEESLEQSINVEVETGRYVTLFNIDADADQSGLTDSDHMVVVLVAEYKEIHGS
jgi:hypothetical protein